MGPLLYYIEAYSDEVMPCSPTLEGWAGWLAAPAPEWGRPCAAADGDRFKCTIVRFDTDIVLSVDGEGGIAVSHRPDNGSFFALRVCEGGGWDADDIIGGDLDDLDSWLADPDTRERIEDGDRIAVGCDWPDAMLVFHADGPRLTVEPIQ